MTGRDARGAWLLILKAQTQHAGKPFTTAETHGPYTHGPSRFGSLKSADEQEPNSGREDFHPQINEKPTLVLTSVPLAYALILCVEKVPCPQPQRLVFPTSAS